MKKVFLLILIVSFQFSFVNSQTPQAFKYQAVARDVNGKELADKQLNLRIGISKSNTGSPVVYSESFIVTTNALGLFNIEIGNGTLLSGSFVDINWAEGPYYISTELSTDGGFTYLLKGVAQLFSVPYALYADKSGQGERGATGPQGLTGEKGDKGDTGPAYYTAGTGIAINGAVISNIMPDQTVTLIGSNNVTVSGTYPEFAIKGTPSLTQAQIDALSPYDGMVVHNKTTNCINYYYGSSWFESCGVCTPQPTKADAGADQLILIGTSATLAANTPVKGTGQWSIISGEGGIINNMTSSTSTFTGKAETKYSLRWAITTSCGVSADTVVIWFWSCGTEITDSRDGKNYQTVIIGSQCWMKQNLNIGIRINGNINQANNSSIEKYCYNNDEGYCNVYGGLYQWNEMMQYVETEGAKGICPVGWHLPSDGEWKQLEMYLGMSQSEADNDGDRGSDECGKLKETGTAHWYDPNTGATNSSGFTALPGGLRDIDGSFNYVGYFAHLWTSSPGGSNRAWDRYLDYDYSQVLRDSSDWSYGFSVRCVKN
ncbi:MAG: hypothetical protein KA792_07830 [Bacteroidales bacterium]|nr:hypothetical protein [Bacteroidales bacterium]